MKRKLKRVREKRFLVKGKCLSMIKKKRFIDLSDLAIYWREHPQSIRKAIKEGRVPVYHFSGHQYIFDLDVIKALPRPKVGRPRKSKIGEVIT